jgi:integrase
VADILFKDAADLAVQLYRGRDTLASARLQFWVDRLGDLPIASIKSTDVEDGVDFLVSTSKRKYVRGAGTVEAGKPLSGSTINRYVAVLGSMYKVLSTHRRLPRGLVSPTKGVQRLPESEGRTLQVSVADVRRLVAVARLSRNRKLAALIAVGCCTGLRMGSLKSIRWGDVDLGAGHIDVSVTKNGRPTRSVMPAWAVAELARIKPAKADDAMLVFGPSNPMRSFRNTLKDAGLPQSWTLHHMRHIAASVLAESGAPLPVVMQALNHRTPLMAMRYAHINTAALHGAVSKAWG